MSAIAGIIHFDGAPVARQDLERMSQALEPFGRDSERIALGHGVGFVVRTTLITPEDRLDRQPVVLADQDRLLFDGRLDNRPDLIRRLGLTESEGRLLADSALVGRAWQRWGRDGLIHLIGIFSIAHWRSAQRVLTLAGSAPGGRFLYVYRQGARLYFASAPHGLFALPLVPREINEAALGDVLLMNAGVGGTLYRDIEMIRGAHWAEYRMDHSESQRYWAPDRGHRLHFKREEEAWEAFHGLFEEVITSHLRAIHPVGIRMSGGLDSAAVAGQAARILARTGRNLRGYTRVPAPDAPLRPDGAFYNDERPRVEQIARMHPNLLPRFIHAGQEPILKNGLPWHATLYGPVLTPTFVSGNLILHRCAAADGVRVLLNGANGNCSFSYDGIGRLRSLLWSGHWLALYREIRALHRFTGDAREVVKSELLGLRLHGALRALRHPVQSLRNVGQPSWSDFSAIARPFAERSGALARTDERNNIKFHYSRLDSWARRAEFLTHTRLFGVDFLQAEYGIEERDAGADRRIVEFCLALPDEFFLKDGIERRFVRLGMAHLIPEAVRLDPTRGRQDVDWALRMRKDRAAISQALDQIAMDPVVCAYLDLPAMKAMWSRFESIDWQHASLNEVIQYNQGFMSALGVGQFVQWFEQRN